MNETTQKFNVHTECLSVMTLKPYDHPGEYVRCYHCDVVIELEPGLELGEIINITLDELQARRREKRTMQLIGHSVNDTINRKTRAHPMIDRRRMTIEAHLALEEWQKGIDGSKVIVTMQAIDALTAVLEKWFEKMWREGYQQATNDNPPEIPFADN